MNIPNVDKLRGNIIYPYEDTEMFDLNPYGEYITIDSARELEAAAKFWKDAHDKLETLLLNISIETKLSVNGVTQKIMCENFDYIGQVKTK